MFSFLLVSYDPFGRGASIVCSTQRAQPAIVRAQRRHEGRVVVVRDTELSARLFDLWRNGRIVDVADAREEVVLDLKVQPAE